MDKQKRWELARNAESKFWLKQDHANPNYRMYLYSLDRLNIRTEGKKILDVGSGAFGMADIIKGGERHAIDPLMDQFIKSFKLPEGVKRVQGKGEELPYKDNFFDIILCVNALDHTEDPDKVINESYRCLKPNGCFFVVVNCYSLPVALVRKFSELVGAGDIHHPYSYTVPALTKRLKQGGFKEIDTLFPIRFNYIDSNDIKKKKPFKEKLKEVRALRGTAYLFKRALVLPLHFIAKIMTNDYEGTIFIFRKEGDSPNTVYKDFDLEMSHED